MSNEGVSLSRRALLAGTAASAGLVIAGAPPNGGAWAKAPMGNPQVPYFYRFKIGNFEATVVSDGPLPLGEPSGSFVGTSPVELRISAGALIFGSNVSVWLGPPCRKRKMTDLS